MLQCKFISSTFQKPHLSHYLSDNLNFVGRIIALSSLPETAGCWQSTTCKRNALPLIKMNFVDRKQLNVDDLLHGSVLRLFSTLRDSAWVQPSLIHQTLSYRVPATSQLFCHCIFSPIFSWKATWLCFMLLCLCINVFFFNISPGGSSVITCLLPFGASLDLLVWIDLLLQRKSGSNQRWKAAERLKLRLSACQGWTQEGKGLPCGFANVTRCCEEKLVWK